MIRGYARNMKIFFIATLGCKVNQYESHSLREAWLSKGWLETDSPGSARLILVNSCAVTAKAVADVRNTVRRLHRAAPQAEILVTGCAAQVLTQELAALPGVSAVVSQDDKSRLLAAPLMQDVHMDNGPTGMPLPAEVAHTAAKTPFPPFSLSGYDRSRAVLKIQDGCSHGCTYCIVPLTRGRARSRDFEDSLAEVRRLIQTGYREITLSGINLRQYKDSDKRDFWDCIAALEAALAPEWTGRLRLRISSLEPGQLTGKALDTLAASRLVAPHLHLSLQSGSPAVLRRMGRSHYDPTCLPDFLAQLRRHWPVFGLGADILTGFPGETEEEFAEGATFCRSLPLTYAHVFPYSRRPGTAAAAMSGQVSPEVKKTRAASLRAMVAEKKQNFLASQLALPQLLVVFEPQNADAPASSIQGVNEYYSDCRLVPQDSREKPLSGALCAVIPVAVDKGALSVRIA